MTRGQGNGVLTLAGMTQSLLRPLPSDQQRSHINGLTDEQFADVLDALALAGVAAGDEPNLFYESAAARLRGRDVETEGSGAP
jgi:hypothetical protein